MLLSLPTAAVGQEQLCPLHDSSGETGGPCVAFLVYRLSSVLEHFHAGKDNSKLAQLGRRIFTT